MGQHLRRGVGYIVLVVLIAAVSIGVGLAVTPDQEVAAADQTIEVGVSAPTPTLSGPGELDLFGQRLDTSVEFVGPVRPKIRLTHITLSQQLRDFTSSGENSADSLSKALVDGFHHYFSWEIAVVGMVAVLLAGAVTGWLRRGWRASVAFIVLALVVTEAINIGAIMSTAYSAPAKLSRVRSLQELVGDAPELQVPTRKPKDDVAGRIVVIGDSTAAGIGNTPVADPTPQDEACRRSSDAFAVALANVGSVPVTNLACSGATIRAGLLGPQRTGSATLPAQLSSRALADASTVVVSVGANDVRWSDQLLVCAVSVSCQNNAEEAAFQQDLSAFSLDYLELLSALQSLPSQPTVVVNLYYDPFGEGIDCLADLGVTVEKQEAMSSKLSAINEVLRSGAEAASFRIASPSFAGHGLCSAAPFVQGVDDAAPFHPTPGGELAIALAVERALNAVG